MRGTRFARNMAADNHTYIKKWIKPMTPHDKMNLLERRLSMLDRETAQRVTRLVFECSASLDLALLAVQDANRTLREQRQPKARSGGGRAEAWLGR
jgi:hypothetical protein